MSGPGTALRYCPACLDKQRQIDELKEEVRLLQDRLRYQERTAQEGPFLSGTPSSQVPFKPSALPERQARTGGGRPGHAGHGRKSVPEAEADQVVDVPAPEHCPECGERLEDKGTRERSVLDGQPVEVVRILYRLQRKRCPQCGRQVQAQAPGVLPKCQYGNGLLTYVATQHYLYGMTLGQLAKQTGVGSGSLVDGLHQLARRLQDVPERLLQEYRRAPVKHADETGWRRDGDGGYAWLFCTPDLSLFRFRSTRSAAVAREVFGPGPLPGVLVVDRYAAYNKAPCAIQYCYAHLRRDLQDLEKNFPAQFEVHGFVGTLAPLLAEAMKLRGRGLSRGTFRQQAADVKRRIQATVASPARHPAVQTYQDLFREKAPRLYHWARDPAIPAENNFAERELRPLVVARKVSFGSQSEAGQRTREILMTVLHTLRKRTANAVAAFGEFLDRLAARPEDDPYDLLFPRRPKPP